MKADILWDVPVSPNTGANQVRDCCAYATTNRCRDGTVVCVYRRGEAKHSYDGTLVTQSSTDNGRTWSDAVTVFDGRDCAPTESVISGNTVVAGDGSIFAIFKVVLVTEEDSYLFAGDGLKQQRRCYKAHSHDGGRSWTESEEISHLSKKRLGIVGKSFVLDNGELFVPVGHGQPGQNRIMAGSFSSDHGRTLSEPVDLVTDSGGQLSHDDPYYAVFADGSAVGLFWTYRTDTEETVDVYRCVSDGDGRRWSAPEPVGMLGQVSVPLVIEGEKLLVASNFRQEPEGIRLWLSYDRGVSFADADPLQMWDASLNKMVGQPVDKMARQVRNEGVWEAIDRFTFGIPDLVDLADGTILMTYYGTVAGVTHIRSCRFRLSLD